MPGLNMIVLSDDAERLRGALMLAMAHAALDGEARLFLQLDAVRLLAPPIAAPRDADHAAAGLPSLASLLEEALESGVSVLACQSGLALANIRTADLDPRIAAGGPISFLQSIGAKDRLLTV
tara:strand:- start:48 stop:413 length:366 start_codon:yes stop_codon:yes gene_type:complete